jgi:hypothetical protein
MGTKEVWRPVWGALCPFLAIAVPAFARGDEAGDARLGVEGATTIPAR